jgi:hypothetical protein
MEGVFRACSACSSAEQDGTHSGVTALAFILHLGGMNKGYSSKPAGRGLAIAFTAALEDLFHQLFPQVKVHVIGFHQSRLLLPCHDDDDDAII